MVSALVLILAAQAGWSVATTSGTYDETTYLGFGRALYTSLDAEALADWGVAPLPVLLTSAAPLLVGASTYPRAVMVARITAIALFGVPLVAVTYWTLLRAVGPGAAIAGTAFISLSPNIVAHASLATADVCFLGAVLLAFAALAHHIEEPSSRSRAILGLTLAVALAAKYSALALFVVVAVTSFAASRNDRAASRAKRLMSAVALSSSLFAIALVFVWALHALALVPFGLSPFEALRLPAPIVGIARQLHHQWLGEPSFLFGQRSTVGWWYYLPAALAMKSTPAELVVEIGALVALLSDRRGATPSGLVWRVAFGVFGGLALVNRVAFGVRYVLVLIPLSVFLASQRWLGTPSASRWRFRAAGALVALQLVSALSIAPHDLSYFNVFAGGPNRGYSRLADSNVDWGQDLPALKAELAHLGARHPLLSYFGTAPVDAYGVRADSWDGGVREPFDRWDWVAISATNLDGVFLATDPFADFRALKPGARAGYSILLYPTSREDVRRAMATAAVRLR